MTDEDKDKMAAAAILSLTVISLTAIIAGVLIAWYQTPIDGVAPVVAGAVGGIVAIVLRQKNGS